MPIPEKRSLFVPIWLSCVCAMVLVMVAVGGITRLTGSGLSITEWKPIMGAIPPLSEAQWNEAFAKYREIPQFKLVNSTMTLDGFKWIFFWEFFHRLIGRSFALVLIVPWIIGARRRLVSRALHRRLAGAFLLFGAQGLMGWIMVASGLSERTSVSHFRLAAHLALAFTTLGYLMWVLRQEVPFVAERSRRLARATTLLLALVALQITYGAFMAGLKAGHMYQTFPTMNGDWVPRGAFDQGESALVAALENPAAVHFLHRTLGWLVLAAFGAFAALAFRSRSLAARLAVAVAVVQFALGVATVVSGVWLPVAVAHQLGGALLLATLLWTRYSVSVAP